MSNTWFQFKQFCIHHDHCAMKVGTDGVLLGAWAPLSDDEHILDVGTGSGLIALMLAQRYPHSTLLGIDIDKDAIEQAQENIAASPFAERVSVKTQSLQELLLAQNGSTEPPFTSIVCNPPFFEDSLLPPDASRTAARHTTSLPFSELISAASSLLSRGGRFCVILPTPAFDAFHLSCFARGLHLEVRCDVQTTVRKAPKRTMACFRKDLEVSRRDEHLILMENGQRSQAYAQLTRDFYL